MTRYSVQRTDRIFIKRYWFCLSLKIWGKILVKISQNWNSKYSQRFLDHSKQMRLKPLQKESFKKQRKQPAI